MDEDKLKWGFVIGFMLLFVGLSTWNENHFDEGSYWTDPLLIPIPIIIAGILLYYTWWYKMKDGNPREFSITGNFTIANNDPLCYIEEKGPWPRYSVYARNGIWRPKFVLNLWGGGKKFGYDAAPVYCYEKVGVQVFNRVAKKKKYVTPEQKSELPPHLIDDLINELDAKGLMYDHETTPIWFGTRPSKLPPDIDPKKIEDQSEQVASLCSELTKAKSVAGDWNDRYSSLLRSVKAQESGLLKKLGFEDEDKYQPYQTYGGQNDRRQK